MMRVNKSKKIKRLIRTHGKNNQDKNEVYKWRKSMENTRNAGKILVIHEKY